MNAFIATLRDDPLPAAADVHNEAAAGHGYIRRNNELAKLQTVPSLRAIRG